MAPVSFVVIATRGRTLHGWTPEETVIQPWGRVTCSHPGGAPLATTGSQALRSRGEDEPHARPTVGMMGMDKGTEAFTLRLVTRAERERPFGSRAKTA
jgi:hypothetical protein